jgi:hypothetical protein
MRFGFRFFYKPESAAWLLSHHIAWEEPVTRPLAAGQPVAGRGR